MPKSPNRRSEDLPRAREPWTSSTSFAPVHHASVSRRLLYLRFEQQLGKSVLQAITDRRVELLKARLRSGKGSLETLALDCGFPTAGQARRVFKSATGLTLRAFRQTTASRR